MFRNLGPKFVPFLSTFILKAETSVLQYQFTDRNTAEHNLVIPTWRNTVTFHIIEKSWYDVILRTLEITPQAILPG